MGGRRYTPHLSPLFARTLAAALTEPHITSDPSWKTSTEVVGELESGEAAGEAWVSRAGARHAWPRQVEAWDWAYGAIGEVAAAAGSDGALARVLGGCGEVCDTSMMRGEAGLFFPRVRKQVDCRQLWANAAIDASRPSSGLHSDVLSSVARVADLVWWLQNLLWSCLRGGSCCSRTVAGSWCDVSHRSNRLLTLCAAQVERCASHGTLTSFWSASIHAGSGPCRGAVLRMMAGGGGRRTSGRMDSAGG